MGELPNEQSVDESPPEQSVGELQSVGVASKYENRHQPLRVNPFWALSCLPAQDSSRDKVRRRRVVTCESHEFGPAQSSRSSSSLSVDPTLTPSCNRLETVERRE